MIDKIIANVAATRGDDVAFVEGDFLTRFSQLHANTNAAANTLLARGVKPGDRVILFDAEGAMGLAAVAGVMRIGAVAIPLAGGLPYLATRALHDACGDSLFIQNVTELYQGSGEEPDTAPPSDDQVAILFHTSGTTGRPKLSATTNTAMAHRVSQAMACGEYEPGDALYSTFPLMSSVGLRNAVGALSCGAKVIRDTAACQGSKEAVMLRGGATHLLTSTDAMASLAGNAFWGNGRLKRITVQGKGHFPDVVRFRETFPVPLTFTYGMSEVGTVASVSGDDISQGVIGAPVPGCDVKLDAGEICVRTKGLMLGYWSGAEIDPVELADGWFRTGDLGSVDNGIYTVLGRKAA